MDIILYYIYRADEKTKVIDALNSVNIDESRSIMQYRDSNGNTLLHDACKHRAIRCVSFFAEQGMSLNDPNREFCSPLHLAVLSRSAPIVELLITRGAITNSLNNQSKTAFDLAQEKGFVDIVRVIERLVSFFAGYVEKKTSNGLLGMSDHYSSKWISVMNKINGDSFPEGGRLIYYESNQHALPEKIFPLYGAKLFFEDSPDSLSLKLTTRFSDGELKLRALEELKLRAPDRNTFKHLVAALTGQHHTISSSTSSAPSLTSPHLV